MKLAISIKLRMMILIGTLRTRVMAIPNTPETNPIRMVSALKILAMSFFLAPSERIIPISFVLSMTET